MQMSLKDCFCTLFFRPKTRPRTSLQCFALDSRCSKAKHCKYVLGRVLGRKNKVQNPSFHQFSCGILKMVGPRMPAFCPRIDMLKGNCCILKIRGASVCPYVKNQLNFFKKQNSFQIVNLGDHFLKKTFFF